MIIVEYEKIGVSAAAPCWVLTNRPTYGWVNDNQWVK